MGREILFRGQQKGDRKWIEGSLVVWPDGDCEILTADWVPYELSKINVHPETVGQFTGYLDGTGQKIYEGDIVERTGLACAIGIVRWYQGVCNFEFGEMSGDTFTGFAIKWIKGRLRCDIGHWHRDESVRVIGNIHDNPELLSGGADNGG